MLVAALAMVRVALSLRVRRGPTSFDSPPLGVFLVFTGFALLGTSVVLLLRSPFRMSPTERMYRLIWLGPIGRGFVWLATRRVRVRNGPPERVRVARPVAGRSAAPRAEPPLPRLAEPSPLVALEARVSELERWQRARDDGRPADGSAPPEQP
jgi:hypothetical protein